jgi:hypothetical protein
MQPVVYYADADYAGVTRRLLIDFVDTGVAMFASIVCAVIASVALDAAETVMAGLVMACAIWILYFVVWKGSRFRTLGYVLAGARIVDLHGQRPRRSVLLLRLAFVVFGPANFMIDLLWVSSDPSRQALRDKFAHTYVVRKEAVPAGTGRVIYPTYMVFGWTLMFAEVSPGA